MVISVALLSSSLSKIWFHARMRILHLGSWGLESATEVQLLFKMYTYVVAASFETRL